MGCPVQKKVRIKVINLIVYCLLCLLRGKAANIAINKPKYKKVGILPIRIV